MLPGYLPPTPETLSWVEQQVHPRGRVTTVRRLVGGITAAMDRLEVSTPSGTHEVVLRRWLDGDEGGGRVEREAAALAAVEGSAVPAPRLLGRDADGSESGVPCTLTTALPGQPDLAPADLRSWLTQLAQAQAAVHAVPHLVPTRWHGWWSERERPLDWVTDRGLRDAAREAATGALTREEVLVHGDFQPFNVLWSKGRLSGVVDWPNASTGNRGSDVGHCRLNLAVLVGPAAAADYLTLYERAAEAPVDRRADLEALLCFDVDWQRFIPVQVAGRAAVDVAAMPARVADTVRAALDALT